MVLAIWACAFACGIAVAILAQAHVAAGFGLAALGLAAGGLSRRSWVTAVAAGALAAGAGLASTRFGSAQAPPAVPEDTLVRVVGQVVMGPEAGAGQGESKKTRFLLAVHSVDASSLEVRLLVTVVEGVLIWHRGDEVAFSARFFCHVGSPIPVCLTRFFSPRPKAWICSPAFGTLRTTSSARAAGLKLAAPTPGLSPALGHGKGDQSAPHRSCGGIRAKLWCWRAHRGITEVEEGFRAAGATHVLSVSGLHLAVVAALVFGLLRRLALLVPQWALRVMPRRWPLPCRCPRWCCTPCSPARQSPLCARPHGCGGVGRDAGQSAILPRGQHRVRRSGLAGRVAARSAGYLVQLSFASVIALGFFAQRFSPAAPPKGARRWRRALSWLGRCLAASSVASLSTMPLVAHHFGEVTPAAPVGNLVLVPAVELAVLPCGLVGRALGPDSSGAWGPRRSGSRVWPRGRHFVGPTGFGVWRPSSWFAIPTCSKVLLWWPARAFSSTGCHGARVGDCDGCFQPGWPARWPRAAWWCATCAARPPMRCA